MTEIRRSVHQLGWTACRYNRRDLTNVGGQQNSRLSSSGGVRFMPTGRRSIAVLIAALVLIHTSILIHQHHVLLLSVMETKDGNDLRNSNVIRRHSVIRSRDTKANNVHTEKNDRKLRLRHDWTNLSPSLELTNHVLKHQSDCSIPMSTFTYRNRFGLGSDLHVYSQALGYGIETNRRIRTVGNWTWMDQSECGNISTKRSGIEIGDGGLASGVLGSPMKCYFATSELNCPGDVEYAVANPEFDPTSALSKSNGNLIPQSSDYTSVILTSKSNGGEQLLQTAVVESLFTRVTPLVVREAERQLNLVFGGKDKVPKDLITVHIRWGDKVATFERGNNRKRYPEMKKVDITEYIDAINQILDQRKTRKSPTSESTGHTANIYLATEDPEAVKEFRKALPDGWNLFVDQFLAETSRHRVDGYNGGPKMAKALNGKAGLLALGSLLVAMEADDFVLTTKSNWSLLMDELRRAILDPRCDNCTSVVDLRR